MPPSSLVEVEGVGGMAHAHEGEVTGVDGVRDRFLVEEGEVLGDLAGGGGDGDVAEDLGGEAAAEVFGIGFDVDGEGWSGLNFGVEKRVSPLRRQSAPRLHPSQQSWLGARPPVEMTDLS